MQPEEGRHVLQYAARPASPPAPPPRPPTGTTPPPTLCARARAEDTDKCKNFLQLIDKNPEKCSSSKNFAKRCRASCHAHNPTMNYCAQGSFAALDTMNYCAAAEDHEQLMGLFTNYALSCKEGVRAGAKPASEGNVEGEMQDGALSSFSYCFQADGVTPATIGVGGSVTYAIKDICPKTCGVCATVPTVDEPKVSEWAATKGIQEIDGVAPHVCPYLKALGYCETRPLELSCFAAALSGW